MKTAGRVGIWIALVGLAAPVHAGPLADALARHTDKEVATLRAQLPGDAAVRCTLGAIYAKRNDLTRAHFYLTDCEDAKLPDDIAADVVKLVHETHKKTRASDLAVVELVSNPTGLVVDFDALPDETITTPATLWITAGTYTAKVTASGRIFTNVVVAKAHSRTATIFEATPPPVASPTNGKIDFTDEPGGNATGEQHKGAPANIKHPPLTPDKYRGVTTASGPTIDDPLAARAGMRIDRGWSLGARVGGGMFDHPAADARAGLALAAVGRFTLPIRAPRRVFVDARLDWSRRGGSVMDEAVDSIGASPAIGIAVLAGELAAVNLSVGPRLDLRVQSRQGDLPIRRAGLGAVIGLDVALENVPITAGARFEYGLTELYSGARDRALIVELGFDWR